MARHLCIHGHFYQPPREDPWQGDVLPEGSAAPAHDWNERIHRESYAPLAWARRLDANGRIADIMNCYEWMSFNVGPTLLRWMDRHAPDTLRRMVEGDRQSLARWGHGNALAQVYHHIIMPLATVRDREMEVAWAVDDFMHRFGRKPEGMWLAESAADLPSLETLADAGIAFTILAPRQARAVAMLDGRPADDAAWMPVDEHSLDIRDPYLVELPSGRSMAVFFYDGALSRAVAFERLLQDGEGFWRRLVGAAGPGLLSVCTDGETYGHHFTFGEMALAHVLGQGYSGRDDLRLTNYAAQLERTPPRRRVLLHEPSSWSCAHGVERWRSDCGCTDGGHPGWNQRWRKPLREGLDAMKREIDAHFSRRGASLFYDPWAALRGYGKVLATQSTAAATPSAGSAQPAAPGTALPDALEDARSTFAAKHLRPDLAPSDIDTAWRLLAMQEAALAAFASCAWFFDEISRIEPVNAMTYALRASDLAAATGTGDIHRHLLEHLQRAVSNKPEEGTGADIFTHHALPRRETVPGLVLQALCLLEAADALPAAGDTATWTWPGAQVAVRLESAPGDVPLQGMAEVRLALEPGGETVHFAWTPPHATGATGSLVRVVRADGTQEAMRLMDLARNRREALLAALTTGATRRADELLGPVARTMLPLVSPWEEAQRDMVRSEAWASLLPTLGLATITGCGASPETLRLVEDYLRANLGAGDRRRLARLAEGMFTELLDAPEPDWDKIERRIVRTRALLPDMDWWSVQNRIWQWGLAGEGPRRCAVQLGFRV